jgi:putative nucleotidyltransferase with HDIG domain
LATSYRTIDKNDFFPFAGNKLIVGTRLPFDIYQKKGTKYEVLFDSGTDFTAFTRDFLIEHHVGELYVTADDKHSLDSYLAKGFTESESILENGKIFKDYTFHKNRYYQIDRQMLMPGTEVQFSVYYNNNYDYAVLFNGTPEKPALVDPKVALVHGDLMILNSDIPNYSAYLSSLLVSEKIKNRSADKLKALLIKENSKIVIKDLLDDPRSGEKIKKTQDMVSNMIESIMADHDTIYDLLSIRGFDYYTYTHSVNVAVLAVGLGIATSIGKFEVQRLGMGAMVHDIGKSCIPSEILNKQGKLDDTEYGIIKSHVAEGEKILRQNHRLPEDTLSAVTQHHEKMSGRGYPGRLTADRITLFGRITAIADCYDALTTSRPYKPSFTPFHALNIISKETEHYDTKLLKLFIKMLGKIE